MKKIRPEQKTTCLAWHEVVMSSNMTTEQQKMISIEHIEITDIQKPLPKGFESKR